MTAYHISQPEPSSPTTGNIQVHVTTTPPAGYTHDESISEETFFRLDADCGKICWESRKHIGASSGSFTPLNCLHVRLVSVENIKEIRSGENTRYSHEQFQLLLDPVPFSPPDNSISTDKVLSVYKYTSNAPVPLQLGPEAKRIPTSPLTGTSQILPYFPPLLSSTLAPSSSQHPPSVNDFSQEVIATCNSPLAPWGATPHTAYSSVSSSYDRPSSADEIGIGFALLQDLANGMGSSDEDEKRRSTTENGWFGMC
jgi:hypothetical protein